jgi:hypothetical protein
MSVIRVPLHQAYEPFVQALPEEDRLKARHVLKITMPTLDIRDRIVYKDGTVGSNLLDLLRYYTKPESIARPSDYSKFQEKLRIRRWIHMF